jgi:C1A family cysteine protease
LRTSGKKPTTEKETVMPDNNNKNNRLRELRSRIAASGATWKPAETSISALGDDEFMRRLGVAPPRGKSLADIQREADAKRATSRAEVREAGAPAAYDLRNVGGKNFITAIRDQGSCGSCVAFGVCAAMEGTYRVAKQDPNLALDLSEAHLFYCHGRAQGRTCDNGWIPDQALANCKSTGIVDEACYPYTPGDQNCTGRCSDWQQRLYKVTGFHLETSLPAMKTWLSTKGPLTACFIVYDDFRYYGSGIYRHTSGVERGGHCVTIVGYDDNAKCWICKNSWGAGWGENGFFKIGYGECAIDTWQVCAVEGVTAPAHDDEQDDEGQGTWQKNRMVTALWCNDQVRNGWIYADKVGWRKLGANSDVAFANLLTQSAAAKAARRPVNFLVRNDAIAELYVI